MSSNLSVRSTRRYVERTGELIHKLRNGSSYDDETGLMIPNKELLRMLYAFDYNFRVINSYKVLSILREYIIGFENVTSDSVDVDSIKYAVIELIS